MKSVNKSANNKKFSVISAVIVVSLVIAGVIASAASASNISNMSRGGGANSVVKSSVKSSVKSPANTPVKSTNTAHSKTHDSSLANKPPKRKLDKYDVSIMPNCVASIETKGGVKYLVIKPEDHKTECVITGDKRNNEGNWYGLRDVITKQADGATLSFEGNVYGYGALVKYTDPDPLTGIGWGSSGLFENSGIKSLGNIGRFDVSNVTSFEQLFKNCSSLTDVSGLKDLDVSNVETMEEAFNGCNELSDINALSKWNVSKVTSFRVMFGETDLTSNSLEALKDWDVSNVKDMSSLFSNCKRLTNVDALKNWNVGNVTNVSGMFDSCSNLEDADGMKKWNMSNVTYMHGMFQYCYRLERLDASNWDVSNVTDFRQMFISCGSDNGNAVIDFSNKTFNENADMTSAFRDYYGVIIANGWNTDNIKTVNLKDINTFGYSSKDKQSLSIVVTNNWKVLYAFRNYKFTPTSKKITIRYKNKNNPEQFRDFSYTFNAKSVYDSRINPSTGDVDKSKPASNDVFTIVNYQVNKLIKRYVKNKIKKKAQYNLTDEYEIVPSKNITKNVMSLFQEYYVAPIKESKAIEGKMKYIANKKLKYKEQKLIISTVSGSGKVRIGALDSDGNWNEDIITPLDSSVKPQDGKTEVGNVETKEEVINFKTKNVNDSTLEKGQTKVRTAGKKGSRKVTTTYVVDPYKGLTKEVEAVRGEYIAPVDEVILVGTKDNLEPPAPTPPTPPTPPDPSNPEEPDDNDTNIPHNPDNPDHHNPDNPPDHDEGTTPEVPSDTGHGIDSVWPYIPELNIHGGLNSSPNANGSDTGKASKGNDSTGNGTCNCSCTTDVNSGNANNANSNNRNRNGMNLANNAKIHGALSKTGSAAFAVLLVAFGTVIIGLIGIYAVKRNSSKHKNSRHSITYNFIR